MIDVKLLGTGGMMPLTKRYLTSLLIKYNGMSILLDCGEGTQLALRNADESSKDIDIICITHFHADHIAGLPGMLLLMGNQGKVSPLTIIGPPGITKVVAGLRVIAPQLPYNVNIEEIGSKGTNTYNVNEITQHAFKELSITAFKVKHKVACYGYTFDLSRLPKFDIDKAKFYGIDKKYWSKLQHGETISTCGMTYTPDMVLGEARKGLKITYVTDTRPCDEIVNNALGSDLFICEGMYGDKEKITDAKEKKHMMMQEAAKMAVLSCVKELWLTHFSPSEVQPKKYIKELKESFNNTVISKDGEYKLLKFED